MIRIYGLFLVAAIGFTASGETINLKGKVTNESGKPIAGAIVTLVGSKLNDTTDANGAYQIGAAVPVKSTPIMPGVAKISMVKSSVVLSLVSPSMVKIELFDMRGNLLEKVVNLKVSQGDYSYNLAMHRYASKMMIVRVAAGTHTSTFRYLPMNKGENIIGSFSLEVSSSENRGERLSKIQAVVDTMRVTASNYVTKELTLSSFQGDMNVTLDSIKLAKFSFFVTSMKAIQELSGSKNGFGGDLRFGKTGPGAGLRGADSICQCIAEKSMPGSKVKIWRAFLSVTADENGKQVDAADRIGNGPWYDRTGKLLAPTLKDLINERPMNGDASIKNDLPNEDGIPNHRPDPAGELIDNHHMITGSTTAGKLYSQKSTCLDWTTTDTTNVSAIGQPRCGFAWPRSMGGGGSASNWISGFNANGCGAGIEIVNNGAGSRSKIIGSGGGYGGFYCFALNP